MTSEMPNPEEARAYLGDALSTLQVDMKEASLRLGKNHAYLQQYIKTGKPTWLPEQIRNALVYAYGIDGERLKPPPVALRPANHGLPSHEGNSGGVHTPRKRQRQDKTGELELIGVWNRIPPDRRPLAIAILRNLIGK